MTTFERAEYSDPRAVELREIMHDEVGVRYELERITREAGVSRMILQSLCFEKVLA